MSDRKELLDTINSQAIVKGHVILSSGKEADYYVDMRRVTLSGSAAPMVGRVMSELVSDLDFDAVGGLTMGADPVAAAIVHARAAQGKPVDSFVVRKEAKTHGLHKRIEGPEVSGRKVLIVEDTSTTGGSALEAVKAVREAGADVVAVAVIVDRNTGAADKVRGYGLEYRYAYSLDDLAL